ncbi:MAG: SPOR domain-containing protein [Sphingobium sp.]
MNRTTFKRAGIASLLVATTMAGCTGAALRPSVKAGKADVKAQAARTAPAGQKALAAEKAIKARDGAAAVAAAEAAVSAASNDAAYRALLGRAYVAAGRFTAAQDALTDATALGQDDARTLVTLALVRIALGQDEAARALLNANTDKIPAADFGLALALAGDPQAGVDILTQAANASTGDARTRQNLAYAYALSGRWKDARLMAGKDLAPLAANQRIVQWAGTADPALAPQRIAALLGVTLDPADTGQPATLAFAPAAPVQAPVEMAAIAPEPAPEEPAPQTLSVAPPVIKAPDAPVRTALFERPAPAAKADPVKPAASPSSRSRTTALKPVGSGASPWVVQLGAYDSPAIARERWMTMARGNATLAAFPVLTSKVTVKGKAFHRLAITGFASRADANSLCRSLGHCFVREQAPGATLQRWAIDGKPRQLALR